MTLNFQQSSNWENEKLTCPKCGWQGTFLQGVVEVYEDLSDCTCPKCEYPDAPVLATVSHIIDPKK